MLNWIYTILGIVPSKILIKRVEDYHTHYIGKCSGDRLFWGYLSYSLTTNGLNKVDYVVLHLFDKKGNHIESNATDTYDINIEKSEIVIKTLEKVIEKIGPVKFCDIKVRTFQVIINGVIFGLIPDNKFKTIDLEPSSRLSFAPPWRGYYDT